MKERSYFGPMNGKNPIKYYVNEEKKTCVAVLDYIPWDMEKTVRSFTNKNRTFPFTLTIMDEFLDGIPDKITATAKCSDLDEFNAETGCALARARMLAKLYTYREKVMNRVGDYYQNLAHDAYSNAYHYADRADEYNVIIDTTINETFGI